MFVLYAFDALAQLNGLLRGMHRAGRPAVGVGDLSDLFSSPRKVQPERVADVWSDHADATFTKGEGRPQASYQIVYGFHFAIDCVLAVVLGVLLVLTTHLLAVRFGEDGARRLARTAIGAAGLYIVFDLAENIVSALVVRDEVKVEATIWALSWAKWLTFSTALVCVVTLAAAVWRHGSGTRSAQLREVVLRVRVYVLLVLVFTGMLVVHEQVPDVVRRWTPFQLGITFAFALFLAVVLWVLGHLLIDPPDWWERANVRRYVAFGLIALAGLEIGVTLLMRLAHLDWDVGWGLAIPALFVGLIWALGRRLPPPPAPPPAPPGGRVKLYQRSAESLYGGNALPAVIGASVLVGLGLGLLRASFGDGVYTRELWSGDFTHGWEGELRPAALLAVALLLPFAAWVFYEVVRGRSLPLPQPTWIVLAIGLFAVQIGISAFVWLRPLRTGETLGGVALLAVALAGVAYFVGVLVWLADAVPLPAGYRNLNLRRAPVVLLLVAWFVIASKIDATGSHEVRLLERGVAAARGATLDQAWSCWLVKNGLEPSSTCGFTADEFKHRSATKGTVPLLFVATSGGATRAAYWTSTVLDCLLEIDSPTPDSCNPQDPRASPSDFRRSNAVFALSGISGGSVGLASYAARLVEKAATEKNDAWIDDRLDRDFLSPTIAWALYIETPQSFLRFRHPVDRAEILEHSWEQAWAEGGVRSRLGLFQLWRQHHVAPLLLLNGTSVEDGCRYNGSVLDASVETMKAGRRRFHDCRASGAFDAGLPDEPKETLEDESALAATRDLVDFLCDRNRDMRLSTAAILSARFPYVSPSGRLRWQCEPQEEDEVPKTTYVVDGGYLETSGASPIVEIWDRLQTRVAQFNGAGNGSCVVPFFIQIDNGYEDDAAAKATKRPSELGVPERTIIATRSARAVQAKVAASLIFGRPLVGLSVEVKNPPPARTGPLTDRYAHFVIQSHAGPKAPLGWALSDTARNELRSQLGQPKNVGALREVRSWLADGALSCAPLKAEEEAKPALQRASPTPGVP